MSDIPREVVERRIRELEAEMRQAALQAAEAAALPYRAAIGELQKLLALAEKETPPISE